MSRRRLLTAISLAWMSGCATTILPPEDPPSPVSVFVADYGRHASLLLPERTGESLVEYAYGEWKWYAFDESRSYRVFPTLFWPTRGTLGRRALFVPIDANGIRRALGCEEVLEVVVASEDASSLLMRLETEFESHLGGAHFQPLYDAHFVPSDKAFHLFHNCNRAVANWLRELGCEVRGLSVLADFVVQE